MPEVKAKLTEMEGSGTPKSGGVDLTVDFNPQSLRLTYNAYGPSGTQTASDQSGQQNTTRQLTGQTTELSLELLFDTSTEENGTDVRGRTLQLARLIKPSSDQQSGNGTNTATPLVRFQWGTFLFTGFIHSMTETIDFFSAEGVPLRATVNLTLSEVASPPAQQTAGSGAGAGAGTGTGAPAGAGGSTGANTPAGGAVGTTPLTQAQAGDTVQSLAAGAGRDWRTVATANNIDNPRLLAPGAVLNLNARAPAPNG